jgi:N-lysine methyltransferase SETD6
MMSETLQNHSKWSPYFAVLPPKLNSLVFWLPTELAELQASAVLQKIRKSEAEELYCQMVAPLGMNGVTLGHFHRMASIIMAYAFDIPEDDPESKPENHADEDLILDDDDQRIVLTMIPLADMLNSDADRNNARLIYDNEDLEMRSIKTISKGEEILNDYGLLPRSDLLRRYGYITDQYAPYDVVELSTDSLISALQSGLFLDLKQLSLEGFNPADLEARLDLARREDVYEKTYDISHATPEEPSLPDELIALIYLLLIDQFTLSSIQRSESSLPSRSKMATSLLGAVLRKLLEMREKEYATSLEEDDTVLRIGKSSHRCTLAIRVRQGEKIILREAIAEAATFQGSNKHMRGINLKRDTPNKATKPAKRMKFS